MAKDRSRSKARAVRQYSQEWVIPNTDHDRQNVMTFVPESGLLSPREQAITDELDIDALLAKLATGEYTAVEVTTAFYKRAVIAHQLTNCLTEIFVPRAIELAQRLDDHFKKTGTPVGPLHGLPVSLKDQFSMRGLETIMGYVSWVGRKADKDCVLVELLQNAGAIPFTRTNVPQTLMWGETFNHVFGRTSNPFNRTLTPGGSSGGEGALLALRGSPLGIGTDIGGSVRIPASFCGLWSLRPSMNRFPYQGAVNSCAGQDSLGSVLGPMAGSLSALKIFTQAILSMEPWRRDSLVIRKSWDEDAYKLKEHNGGSKLCFGLLHHDGETLPNPPVQRAMQITTDALKRAGHIVIDWDPTLLDDVRRVSIKIYLADGGEDFKTSCAPTGEPLISSMVPGQEEVETSDLAVALSAYQLWKVHEEKRQIRKDYLDHWEKSAERTGTGRPIDALVSPVAAYPAPMHGHNSSACYTHVWNALDYPAIAFLVTVVDQNLDKPSPPRQKYMSALDKEFTEFYDPAKFKDAPVGLQVIAGTLEEEALLGMAKIIEEALRA